MTHAMLWLVPLVGLNGDSMSVAKLAMSGLVERPGHRRYLGRGGTNISKRTNMDFHKIWIEQCETAKGMVDEFGT
jgi:hypothetical protein